MVLAQDVVDDGNTGRREVAAILIGEVPVTNGIRKGKKREVWGWLLFVTYALFFIASSIRNGDMIGLLGGVFFPGLRGFSRFIHRCSQRLSQSRKSSMVAQQSV